jgi:predicted AlkP superfamily phosphohydrolase/phosphomutase
MKRMRFLCGIIALAAGARFAAAEKAPRVVVLAFDGVDASVVEDMTAKGRLPNLDALARRGGYSPLTPTVPAQTPVSWSTFATGLDPGGHEIFDFLKRDPKDRVPSFAVAEEIEEPLLLGKANAIAGLAAVVALFSLISGLLFARRLRGAAIACEVVGVALGLAVFYAVRTWIPPTRPSVRNNRRGETFWSVAAARPATVMRMPVTFPPEVFEAGRLVSGLGVPDMSGRIGRPTFYTSDPFYAVREGNDFSIDLVRLPANTGKIDTKITGPPGKPFGMQGWIELPVSLTVSPARDNVTIAAGGSSVTLGPGQWSGFVSLPFRVNPLITLHGYARFRLESVDPEVNLYLSPIQLDPQRLPPGVALSSPRSFAADLVSRFGRYKTMGWGIDTWSIQSGTLKEQGFLEDVAATVEQERRMLNWLLAGKERLLVHYFEFPDRIAHVFWRLRDPKHPAYDAALAARYGDAVEKSYETMDAIVGETSKALAPEDVLIVLSDHGFASWRRSVNYNTWLVEAGYLVLKGDARRKNLDALFSRGQFWESVDWSKTKAYSMGFGDIYVNLKGRESEGIVEPGAEYEKLREEITARLLPLSDPKTGERAVSRVFKREDVYRRFDPRLIPDLIASNRAGYRVSWQSTLGVPTAEIFEDNKDVWSGDHCSLDPDLVRGILFSSKAFRKSPVPGIADVTASVRALLGAPADPNAAGKPLW